MVIGERVEIKGDVFNIAKRLKEIDKGYFVVYSRKKSRFEVHNRFNRGGNTFCLVVPYPFLDARTVELVQKTRAERVAALFLEAERANADLLKREKDEIVKKAEYTMERALSDAGR